MVDGYAQRLLAGDSEGAWSLFLEQYGALLLAVIKRYHSDYDEMMDAYAYVCEKLSQDDLGRLRKYSERAHVGTGFTAWLIVVVRNLVVDLIRHRDGRSNVRAVVAMTAIENRIHDLIFVQRRSHREAYELLLDNEATRLSHRDYLQSLRAVHRYVFSRATQSPVTQLNVANVEDLVASVDSAFDTRETALQLNQLMATLDPADRLAVRLFVEEDMSAADVAIVLGWRNAKAVYNRVYRALAVIHAKLQDQGLRRGDF